MYTSPRVLLHLGTLEDSLSKENKLMGDKGGKKDKGKKEQQKQAKQTLKEKRRSKKEKML